MSHLLAREIIKLYMIHHWELPDSVCERIQPIFVMRSVRSDRVSQTAVAARQYRGWRLFFIFMSFAFLTFCFQ